MYSTFGLTYQIELSTMPEDHMGDEEVWHFAEDTLQAAITELGKDFQTVITPIKRSMDPSRARWIMMGRCFSPSSPTYSSSNRSGICISN